MLFLIAALVLIPLVATVLGGFKSLGDLRVESVRAAGAVGMEQLLVDPRRRPATGSCCGNSLVIAVLTVVLTLATAAMAAFVFAHVQVLRLDAFSATICCSG